MTLTLGEMIGVAEEKLDRMLTGDEIALVGRMLDAERGEEDILAMLDVPEVVIPQDDELDTYRYEASGAGVVPIPEPKGE